DNAAGAADKPALDDKEEKYLKKFADTRHYDVSALTKDNDVKSLNAIDKKRLDDRTNWVCPTGGKKLVLLTRWSKFLLGKP
ncbi:unnamed protein product, partial [Amoebophrya sp. A120]